MLELPKDMKAAAADTIGGPEVVHTAQVPVPKLGPGEVLLRVDVAGVGVWDPALVAGEFSDARRRFPRVYGSDGSGTVVAVGARVRKHKPGDRVYGVGFGNAKGGFYAEYAVLPAESVAAVPRGVSASEAGALAISGITALLGLEALRVRAEQPLLIIGASGGVGHLALQLAKRLGARVLAVASGTDGVALVKRLGADAAIDGKRGDVSGAARAFAPGGYDGALVLAGRDDGWRDVLALVRPRRSIAYPNGVEPAPIAPSSVKLKSYDGVSSPAAFARLQRLIEQGPFHVELCRTYPLEKAAQALRDVTKHHVGKLALRVH